MCEADGKSKGLKVEMVKWYFVEGTIFDQIGGVRPF
jgi:hypothetical protein